MAPAVQQMPRIPERIASPWALETAVQTLAKERHDRVPIRFLDELIVGHDRSDIGAVEDVAVVSGGGLPAILGTPDGGGSQARSSR